ncbi:MAG: hypothetical protein GXY34_00280 [Syntrophomonadaceae bacterium]|nr:hypothetical protein [Syntrophomonadaceae bacterium]
MLNVSIKEDCKSVLLDNGVEPPMLMDIEAFIQMAVDSRNELAEKVKDLEAQLAQAKADNAGTLQYIKAWLADLNYVFTGKSDKDEVVNDLFRSMECFYNENPHPGADLLRELEEYKLALKRAAEELLHYYTLVGADQVYRENCESVGEIHRVIAKGFLDEAKEALSDEQC